MHNHRSIGNVVHGIAIAFWLACILGGFFALLSYLLLWGAGGIHGANAFSTLDFINSGGWPSLLRAAFVTAGLGAVLDLVLRIGQTRKTK